MPEGFDPKAQVEWEAKQRARTDKLELAEDDEALSIFSKPTPELIDMLDNRDEGAINDV